MVAEPTIVRRPMTPPILGAFYCLASLICAVASASLLTPRGAFDWMWVIKPEAYAQLRAMAPRSGLGFCLLAVAMALASIGCFWRKRWGWLLAVTIFAINGLADGTRLIAGEFVDGLIGVIAAGTILYVLSRPNIRRVFEK